MIFNFAVSQPSMIYGFKALNPVSTFKSIGSDVKLFAFKNTPESKI